MVGGFGSPVGGGFGGGFGTSTLAAPMTTMAAPMTTMVAQQPMVQQYAQPMVQQYAQPMVQQYAAPVTTTMQERIVEVVRKTNEALASP